MNQFFASQVIIKDNVKYLNQHIVAIHLIRELAGDIILTNISEEKITFPKTAFVPGGIYNYPIIMIEYTDKKDNGAFIGCKFGHKMLNS
jgi:hypothetical protein